LRHTWIFNAGGEEEMEFEDDRVDLNDIQPGDYVFINSTTEEEYDARISGVGADLSKDYTYLLGLDLGKVLKTHLDSDGSLESVDVAWMLTHDVSPGIQHYENQWEPWVLKSNGKNKNPLYQSTMPASSIAAIKVVREGPENSFVLAKETLWELLNHSEGKQYDALYMSD
jgi:hypothetical protein